MPGPFTPAAGQLGNLAGVVRQPHPDAELIDICSEFTALEDERIRIADDTTVDDDQLAALSRPIFDKLAVLLDRMNAMRASTAAGVHARARCLALYNGDFSYSFDCQDTHTGRLLAYLMRDALALDSGRVV